MRDNDGTGDVLKGPLSDVFLTALLEGNLGAVEKRLGNRARLSDPRFGVASGAGLGKRLADLRDAWKGFHATKERIVAGVERDVWIGTFKDATRTVNVAVSVERHRMREIDLRLYHASDAAYAYAFTARELAPLPAGVDEAVTALETGDANGLMAQLETHAQLAATRGEPLGRDDAAAFLAAMRGDGPYSVERHGAADDGRCTAVELSQTRSGTRSGVVLVAERGESGLLSSLKAIG